MSEAGEKTEHASELKLQNARKKGQVAKSSDVASFGSLLFALLAIVIFLSFWPKTITGLFGDVFTMIASSPQNTPFALSIVLKKGLDTWLFATLPVLLAASLGGAIFSVLQFGFLFSTHPLKIDMKRINPVMGLKKLFSKDRLVELLKQCAKFITIFYVIFRSLVESLPKIILTSRSFSDDVIVIGMKLVAQILLRVMAVFLVIAVLDYFWSRYSFLKSMRMSKYEVKKEYREQEGDPQLKSERKRMFEEALSDASPRLDNASVLITNPAHLAVALLYDASIKDSPFVVAKGTKDRAKELISLAHQKKIPVIRNVPLAWGLIEVKINEEIPFHLYEAIAEILVFVQRLEKGSEKNENTECIK